MGIKLEELCIAFTVETTKLCDTVQDRKVFTNQLLRSASNQRKQDHRFILQRTGAGQGHELFLEQLAGAVLEQRHR